MNACSIVSAAVFDFTSCAFGQNQLWSERAGTAGHLLLPLGTYLDRRPAVRCPFSETDVGREHQAGDVTQGAD